jgi:hypothetical protein
VLGGPGGNRMKRFMVADSGNIGYDGMKVYLVRVATLVAFVPDEPFSKEAK